MERPEFLIRFSRHLAHELNNPISAIASSAYLIDDFTKSAVDGKVDTELIAPFVESINEECAKLKGVVEEFIRYATTDGALPQVLDLGEFVKARISDLQKKGFSIASDSDLQSLGECSFDSGQLAFVMESLIEWMNDAAPNEEVKVTVERTEKYCILKFQVAMSAESTQESIEEMFTNIPNKQAKGLGVRLPLSREMIERLGGTLHGKLDNNQLVVEIALPPEQNESSI